jgi:ABC-type Mn2+/Zn2+ transport system ATPase subunit
VTVLLEVHDLSAGYGGRVAVSEVEIAAGPGEAVAVLGPNGGGKTTLFHVLIGELAPMSGSFQVADAPAYVPQTDRSRLEFPVSALDVTLMGSLRRSRWWLPAGRAARRAAGQALERVGLGASAVTPFGELSGGQRQRVRIARALLQDSPVVILDEPLAGIDPGSAELINALFEELRAEGRLLLVSTHDAAGARTFDRVLCLNRRQIAYGPPEEVLDREALEATYGEELVILDTARGSSAAVTVQHHEH